MKEYIEFIIPVEMGALPQGQLDWYLKKSKGMIVRCKDCEYYRDDGWCLYNNHPQTNKDRFCADGKRSVK